MKSIILLMLCGIAVSLQAQSVNNDTTAVGHKEKFTCRKINFSKKDNTLRLIDDVRIEWARLYVEADSAVLDKTNNTLVAYGCRQFRFKGTAVLSKNPTNTVRYTLHDDKIYLE